MSIVRIWVTAVSVNGRHGCCDLTFCATARTEHTAPAGRGCGNWAFNVGIALSRFQKSVRIQYKFSSDSRVEVAIAPCSVGERNHRSIHDFGDGKAVMKNRLHLLSVVLKYGCLAGEEPGDFAQPRQQRCFLQSPWPLRRAMPEIRQKVQRIRYAGNLELWPAGSCESFRFDNCE